MQFKALSFTTLLATAAAHGPSEHSSTAGSLTEVVAANPDLSQLGQLISTQPSIASQLGGASNITVLAPSNAAIGALLNSSAGAGLAANPGAIGAILQYHVIQGKFPASAIPENLTFVPTILQNQPAYANVTGGQRLGVQRTGNNVTIFSGGLKNSTVTTANLNFTGGVIHVIDHVLTLPTSASNTLIQAGLSSLAGALTNASLVSTVDSLKDVTIFAPNNAAFQRIGSALPNLTADQVSSILRYHVVTGNAPVYSPDITNGTQVTTVEGGKITLTVTSGGVFVNGAKVIVPNVLIAGGVVHVIDNVLNPNATSAASGSATTGVGAFSGASSVAAAPFTSGIPTPTGGGIAINASTPANATKSVATGAAVPMMTGAVGAAALFGAGAAMINY